MESEGIVGKVYSHPIGNWEHSAGKLIGRYPTRLLVFIFLVYSLADLEGTTNLQDGVPILGELPLLDNTYYSVELYVECFVPEKNVTLNFYLEEDIYWVDEKTGSDWVFGRQERVHLIRIHSHDVLRAQNS